jgi:hypothetical protein
MMVVTSGIGYYLLGACILGFYKVVETHGGEH